MSYDLISNLNKTGCLPISSVLPNTNTCSSYQLSKSKCFSFYLNLQRSLDVLDLIHCDLWGPSPIDSKDDFCYYEIFVDDYSRFTWFYPLKVKSDFYSVLESFISLVQTQFHAKSRCYLMLIHQLFIRCYFLIRNPRASSRQLRILNSLLLCVMR